MEETSEIKRGVDFEARVGEARKGLRTAFSWWKGGKSFNKKTFIFVFICFVLNIIICRSVFGQNWSASYSSSPFLLLVAGYLENLFNLPEEHFFSFITITSISLAPVSFYLFARKQVMRHELTALIATILYIVPNPIFEGRHLLTDALINKDGAHLMMAAFVPVFILYVQMFIGNGRPVLFFMSAIGVAYIAVISAFSFFNLLIILGIIVIAEGFQGELRIKIIRLAVLLMAVCGLVFYWYNPSHIAYISKLPDIKEALDKILGVLPVAVPVLPVAGVLSFLIFDRRKKLKPIFISLSLFIVFLTIFLVSGRLDIAGALSSGRYLLELSMFASLFFAIIIVLCGSYMFKIIFHKERARYKYAGRVSLISACFLFVGFLTFSGSIAVDKYIAGKSSFLEAMNTPPVKNLIFDWRDVGSLFSFGVSVVTLIALIYLIKIYPVKLTS